MATPTFIVGTGRCGSTLLSNIIRMHPDICSLSEFFSLASDLGARFPELFPAEPIDGAQFWELLAGCQPRSNLMVRYNVAMPEVIYPFQNPASRFNGATGVPLIMQTTLPHLTEGADALFDEVATFTRALPPAPVRAQYDALFGWLERRFDKKVWIERSGGIFNIMDRIHATWPEARHVHIVRDGRNTAMSMNEHRGFRMFVLGQFLTSCLGVDPYYSDDRSKLNRVPRQYRAFLPESFDAAAYDRFRFPLSLMGRLWSGQILAGLKILDQIPADRLLTIRYEDLVEDPRLELGRLADFLGEGFRQEDWLEGAARVIRKPSSTWESLSERESAGLTAACKEGFEALAARGVHYEV